MSIWTIFSVRWDFLTELCASVPANGKLVEPWLDARAPEVMPPGAKTIDEIQEEVLDTLANPALAPAPLRVFQRVDGQLVQRAATIRAHLKDCARVLSAQYIGKIKGERSFATRMVNGLYPDPQQYWIPILRPDGSRVAEPDGIRDKPVHARGPRGEPINALKQFEWVEPARLDFRLMVLGKSCSQKDLETLAQYSGVHGFAGERSDGAGKYMATFTLVEEAE